MDLPIIERRRIEAEILKCVYDVLVEKVGVESARETIGEAVSRSAVAQGQSFREALGHEPNFKDFLALLPRWTAEDALQMDVLEASETKMAFNITRCRYAEMYKGMGLGDIGHLLSCNRDGEFCTGYNPKMKLERTQTIMKGASHCDFRYHMEEDADTAKA